LPREAPKGSRNSINLTWTHCHGDCHGFNGRITEAGEATFFDFDGGGPGYLAYDLSVFLWAKVSSGRISKGRPIAPTNFEAAHVFVIVRHIWLMGEYANRVREWGSGPVSGIARDIEFLKTWEAERLADRLF